MFAIAISGFVAILGSLGINFAAMKIATVVGATVYNAVWAAPVAYAFTAMIAQFPIVAFIVALV